MWKRNLGLLLLCLCVLVALGLADTAAAGDKKRQKNIDKWPEVDLGAYPVLCIEEFEMTDPKAPKRKKQVLVKSAPRRLADHLEEVLEPGLFDEVLRGPVDDPPAGTVMLTGEITQYKPGSAVGRAMLAGAGSAHMDFTAHLIDVQTGEELATFDGKKTWAWGGAMGMSKGVADLEQNLAYELALYFERCRGQVAEDEGG